MRQSQPRQGRLPRRRNFNSHPSKYGGWYVIPSECLSILMICGSNLVRKETNRLRAKAIREQHEKKAREAAEKSGRTTTTGQKRKYSETVKPGTEKKDTGSSRGLESI